MTRNSSGYIVDTDGVTSLALSWLSQRLKFTYDSTTTCVINNDANSFFHGRYAFLQVNDSKMEPVSADLPGLTYYLVNGVSYCT